MSNERIIEAINAGGDRAELMLMLWKQNKGLIAQTARRYRGLMEYDDLMQEAYLGLDNAVRTYDPEAGTLFSTYLVKTLRWWIYRACVVKGQAVRLPEGLYGQIAKINAFRQESLATTGKEPDLREIAAHTGLTEAQIKAMDRAAAAKTIASLDSPISGEDGEISLSDALADTKDDIADFDDSFYRQQMKAAVWGAVDELPEQQAVVLHKRFEYGLTIDETAKAIGTTGNAVYLHTSRALATLRRSKYRERLLPYYDGLRSRAMSGGGAAAFNHSWTSSTEREALKLYEVEEETEALTVEAIMRKYHPEWFETEA